MKAMLVPRVTKTAVIALVALLLIDFVLIGLHVWHAWGTVGKIPAPEWVQRPGLSLSRDRGLAEWLNYLQLSIAAGLLVVMAVRASAAPVLAAWAFALAVAVADDALLLHEEGGRALVVELGLPAAFGFRGQDLGELLVWAGMAAIVLPVLVLTHRASDRPARAISWRLVLLLGALAFFGVAVDLLVTPFGEVLPLALAENGGEIVVCTFILVTVIAAATSRSSGPSGAGPRKFGTTPR
jgi:hypothetical protein